MYVIKYFPGRNAFAEEFGLFVALIVSSLWYIMLSLCMYMFEDLFFPDWIIL